MVDVENTEKTPFDGEKNLTINDLADLKTFRDMVNAGNTFSGKTITLAADIDLSTDVDSEGNQISWTPIGNSSNIFKGTFDGNGHTVSNLFVDGGSGSNKGFFGVTHDGEIKNITFDNAKVSGRLNVGVVAGEPYTSKYTNITVTGHVEVNGLAYVGAVGGKNAYANWDNITVNADDTSYVKAYSIEDGKAYRTYVGGVIGFAGEGAHTFSNISSNIDVYGSTCDVGGIIGIAHYGNTLENITCSGNVYITNAGEKGDCYEIGGIAGVWNNEGNDVNFINVKFTGKLSATYEEDGVKKQLTAEELAIYTITGKKYSNTGAGKLNITIAEGESFTVNGGSFDLNGGTLTNNGSFSVAGANFSAGSVVNSGDFTATGDVFFNIGTLTGKLACTDIDFADKSVIGGAGSFESGDYVELRGKAVTIDGDVKINVRVEANTDIEVTDGSKLTGSWICLCDADKSLTVAKTATVECTDLWSSVAAPAYAKIEGVVTASHNVWLCNADIYGTLNVGNQLLTYSNDSFNVYGTLNINGDGSPVGWLIGHNSSAEGAYAGNITVNVAGGAVNITKKSITGEEIKIQTNGILNITKNEDGKRGVVDCATIITNAGKIVVDGGDLLSNYQIVNSGSLLLGDANVKVTYPSAEDGRGSITNKENATLTIGDATNLYVGTVTNNGTLNLSTTATVDMVTLAGSGNVVITIGKDFELGEGESFKVLDVTSSTFKGNITIDGAAGYIYNTEADGDIVITNSVLSVSTPEALQAALEGEMQGRDYIRLDGRFNVSDELAGLLKENTGKLIFAEGALLLWPDSEIPEGFAEENILPAPATPAVVEDNKLALSSEATGIVENVTASGAFEITNDNSDTASEIRSDINVGDEGEGETLIAGDVNITNSGKELQLTGSITASGNVSITNDNNETGEKEAVFNGGNESQGAKVKAETINFTNAGHAVVDFTAKNMVIANNSVNTLTGTLGDESTESIVIGAGTIKDGEVLAGKNSEGSIEDASISAKSIELSNQQVSDTTFAGFVLANGDVSFDGVNTFEKHELTKSNYHSVVKVTNGAVVTIGKDAVINGCDYFYIAAGNDSGYFGFADNSTGSGTIDIYGKVIATQINADASGTVNVKAGAEVDTEIICVENGGISGATAGKMNIDGNVSAQNFKLFNGGKAVVNTGAVLEATRLNNERRYISVAYGSELDVNGGSVVIDTANASAGQNNSASAYLQLDGKMNVYNNGSVTVKKITEDWTEIAKNSYFAIGKDGLLTVTGGTVDVGTLKNAGTINVSGKSTLDIDNLTAEGSKIADKGKMLMNGVELDSKTDIQGSGFIRFVDGTSVIDGAKIQLQNGYFQIGQGAQGTNTASSNYEDPDSQLNTKKGVTVTVQNGADIKVEGSDYTGWIGTRYGAAAGSAKYTLNVNNSNAYFGYLQIWKDGVLNYTAAEKDENGKYINSFHGGKFIVNNSASFDGGKLDFYYVSVASESDKAALTIKNADVIFSNTSNNSPSLTISKGGVVDIADSTVAHNKGLVINNGAELKLSDVVWTSQNNGNSIRNDGTMTITNSSIEAISNDGFINNGVITVSGNVTVNAITNNKTITMDAKSLITAGSITGAGTITVNAKGWSGFAKVVDLTTGEDAVDVVITGNSDAYQVTNGNDTYVTTADKASIMLADLKETAFGTALGEAGKYIAGVNAFDSAADAINAMTDATKTIYVYGTSTGSWSSIENFGTLNFQKFDTGKADQPDAIVNIQPASGSTVGGMFTGDLTIGAGVTLNANYGFEGNYYGNFLRFMPAGSKSTVTVDGTLTYSCGDFGVRDSAAVTEDNPLGLVSGKEVAVVVNKTGKMFANGDCNNTFYANSSLTVTGTGTAEKKMEEVQFQSGSYTSFLGDVKFENTNVTLYGASSYLFGDGALLPKETFAGDKAFTAVNSVINVVGGSGAPDDNRNAIGFDKTTTLKNTDINAGDMFINGKTFTMEGGTLDLEADTAGAYGADYTSKGDLTIAAGATLAMTNAKLDAEGTVTNKGTLTVNGGTFTANSFKQNSSEQAVFNNVEMDVNSLNTGGNAWVVVGGKSQVKIDSLSGSNALRLAAGTTLLDGTSIDGLGTRSLGTLTVGEKATDEIYIYHYDTTRASVGKITVNGILNIGKNNFGIATYITGDSIKLTGAGTVNVDSQVFFEGYAATGNNYTVKGDILVDEKLTINMVNKGDVASHLRFSAADVTIKGIVTNKGTNENLTALYEADVIVTGNEAKLDLAGDLKIGNVYNIYNSTVTDAHKSSLTVTNGASVNAKNVFINLDSKVNINNAVFSVSNIANNGIITISGNSTINATITGNVAKVAKGAVITVVDSKFTADDEAYTMMLDVYSLANLKSINGVDVVGNATTGYSVKIGEVFYSIADKDDEGLSFTKTDEIKTDDYTGSLDGLTSVYAVEAKAGTATLKVNKGQSATVAAITKDENGGVTNLNLNGDLTVGTTDNHGSVEAVGKITTGSDVEVKMGDVSGTNLNSTISLGKNNDAFFDNIDMKGGSNTLSIGANSDVEVDDIDNTGYIKNVKTINLASGTAANAKKGTEADYTTLTVTGDITAPAMSNSITLGNYAKLFVNGKLDNSDVNVGTTIKAGNYSEVVFGKPGDNGEIAGGEVTSLAGLSIGTGSTFKAVNVGGTAGNNTISFGNNAKAKVKGDINLLAGNDTIKTGTGALVEVSGDVKGVETISLGGKGKTVVAGVVSGLNKLTAGNGAYDKKTGEITWTETGLEAGISGTGKNDSISLGNWNFAVINGIALAAGNDTLKVGSDSVLLVGDYDSVNAKMTSIVDIDSVETISIGARSALAANNIAGVNKLTAANGSADKLTKLGTAGTITGTEKNDTITLGNWNDTAVNGGIDLGDGNDTLKVGSDSVLLVGAVNSAVTGADVDGVETITIGARSLVAAENITGVNKLTAANGVKDDTTQIFAAGKVTGTAQNDTISLGNWNAAQVGEINLGAGNDTLKIGNDSLLAVADVAASSYADIKNVETISIGARSQLFAKDITGVNKLTVGNGTYTKKTGVTDWTEVTAGNVTGTAKNDTVSFGNYNDVTLAGLALGDGNDAVKIGNDSIVDLGVVNFGEGKDTMTIGKDAKVKVTSITGLETLNATKGANIWFASGEDGDADVDVDLTGVAGSWKNATIFDDMGEIANGDERNGAVYGNEWDIYELTDGITKVVIESETNSDAIYRIYEIGAWDKAVVEITDITREFVNDLDVNKDYVLAVSVKGADFKNKENYSFGITLA